MGHQEADFRPTQGTDDAYIAESANAPPLSYPGEESHWSQNHGPILLSVVVFVLLAGYGFIFFKATDSQDFSRPLVPNDFVPDEEEGSDSLNASKSEKADQLQEESRLPTSTNPTGSPTTNSSRPETGSDSAISGSQKK